jgi:hypothetical protein
MILAETSPGDWILPAVLVLAWLALQATRRRVPAWFFAAGLLLAILCIPAGMLAGRAELGGIDDCTPGNLCFSATEVDWWFNGVLGFLTTGALALATLVVAAVVAAVRAGRNRNRTGAPQ